MLERAVAELMGAEADALCGAAYGERSPERVNQRNGYRTRRWDTRAGTIELEIPKLRAAARSVMTNAAWQRCRTHYLRNLRTRVPKAAQPLVATLVRSIFAQPDAAQVAAQHERVVDQLAERFPDAAGHLAEAGPEILAFTSFPRSTGARSGRPTLRSGSTRRSAGAPTGGHLPRPGERLRLVGAVPAETHDEWGDTRRHMTVDGLLRPDPVTEPEELLLEQAA